MASIGQEIDVWVLGRTRVRLKVGMTSQRVPILCLTQLLVSLDPDATAHALLIATNTEVSIAPKMHRRRAEDISHRKESVRASDAPSLEKERPSHLLRVLPTFVLPASLHDTHNDEPVAYLSPSTLKQIFPAASSHDSHVNYHRASVRRIQPPKDPSSTAADQAHNPDPLILNPGATHAINNTASGVLDVLLVSVEGIPPLHLVFPILLGGIQEYDIVRSVKAVNEIERGINQSWA